MGRDHDISWRTLYYKSGLWTPSRKLSPAQYVWFSTASGTNATSTDARQGVPRSRPAAYDPAALARHYRWRPLAVIWRFANVTLELAALRFWHSWEPDIHVRAAKLRRSLTRLGPAFIKLGQTLSTRPDVLPSAYCAELAKLQDHVPSFSNTRARALLEQQLGKPLSQVFSNFPERPIAAASLGQVYKAQLAGAQGEWVAVKVQRPNLPERLALDAYLLREVASRLQRYMQARSDLVLVVDEMIGRVFEEMDYIREGHNAERFASLYAAPAVQLGRSNRTRTGIKVPRIFWEYTTHNILTMEWIDGTKLTDREGVSQRNLDVNQIVHFGVHCSLRQLLEEGFFHADPHPGNLVVTDDGSLVYFDFGMCSYMAHPDRLGLIRTLVHFVNQDAVGLAEDFAELGFLPPDINLAPVAEALSESFGGQTSRPNQDFMGILTQLSAVMERFHFQLPARYTLVIRALGSLEGTATALQPSFKVLASAYPFVLARLVQDRDPQMRVILRELLFRRDGSMRWNRMERLLTTLASESKPLPVASPAAVTSGTPQQPPTVEPQKSPATPTPLDARDVAAATSDLLMWLFSGKGARSRASLADDAVAAGNEFLDSLDQPKVRVRGLRLQGGRPHGLGRLSKGLHQLGQVVDAHPALWLPLIVRVLSLEEAQKWSWDVVGRVLRHRTKKSNWM